MSAWRYKYNVLQAAALSTSICKCILHSVSPSILYVYVESIEEKKENRLCLMFVSKMVARYK